MLGLIEIQRTTGLRLCLGPLRHGPEVRRLGHCQHVPAIGPEYGARWHKGRIRQLVDVASGSKPEVATHDSDVR